jgi:protein O-mannosyl-transferase
MKGRINFYKMKFLKTKYLLLFLVIVTLAYYGQSLFFDFLTFDDDKFITMNQYITSDDSSVIDCFNYQFKQHDYFPLTFVSLRILRNLFGLNPFFFHAFNLFLHLFNVIFVFFLGLRIIKKCFPELNNPELWSGVIAIFFSIHPMHVESVGWAIDLKDLLYSFFYLSGLLTYWKWLETRNSKWYLFTILLALLGLLSKSTAITFLATLFLIDWLNKIKIGKLMLVSKIPFLILTIFGFYIFGIFSDPGATLSGLTGRTGVNLLPYFPSSVAKFPVLLQRLVIASFRLLFWMFHSIFPLKLNLFYTRSVLLNQYNILLPFLPVLVFLILIVIWFFRKKMPVVFIGFVFLLITLSPAFAKTDTGLSVFVPDRYMYLPIFGLLIVMAGFIEKFTRIGLSLIIGFIFFSFWTIKTLTYLPVWKNSYTLYNYSLKIDPENQVALLNRSMCYLTDKNEEKAFLDLDLFLKKYPNNNNEIAYVNHGILSKNRGQFDKALEDFNIAIKIKPADFQTLFNRGTLYLAQNKLDAARKDFSDAYDQDSTNYFLNKNISSLYNKSGNHKVALSFAEKCLIENKNDIDLLRIKGVSLFYLGKNKEAIEIFSQVIETDKMMGEIWYFRSMARFLEGNHQEAFNDLIKAKELKFKIDLKYEEMVGDSLIVE